MKASLLLGALLVNSFLFSSALRADTNGNADTLAFSLGARSWASIKAAQPAACNAAFDSTQILRGHRTAVSVLVLHGFGNNPAHLRSYLEFFRSFDINVIAPRLPGHYNQNIRDLDQTSFRLWQQNAEQSFQAAAQLGRKVVIVGYSLGGLLASGLALDHPSQTAGLILLSPAWRVDPGVSLGAALGNILGINGNEYLKHEYACSLEAPYLSSEAGRQVAVLGSKIDPAYPALVGSAFRSIHAPILMALVDHDQVVDSPLIRQIFKPSAASGRSLIVYPGKDHGTLLAPNVGIVPFDRQKSVTAWSGRAIFEQMRSFLAPIIPAGR